MKVYAISNGWFSEVCGRKVIKRDWDEPGYDAFTYDRGHPIGVMEHFTAGCGTDLSGIIQDRGYVICNFSVTLEGAIYQYVPLNRGTWHAHETGENLCGIECSGLPGTCNLTQPQYEALVDLNAAIVQAVKNIYDFDIPYKHVGGCSITTPGYKEHCDGALPDRCGWNPKVHCDNPITIWGGGQPMAEVGKGWDKFFGDIKARLQPEPLPPEEGFLMALTDKEQAQLYAVTYWTMRGTNNTDPPGEDVTYGGVKVYDQANNAWKAGQVVRKAAGLPTRS
jgi:hypothetical protein